MLTEEDLVTDVGTGTEAGMGVGMGGGHTMEASGWGRDGGALGGGVPLPTGVFRIHIMTRLLSKSSHLLYMPSQRRNQRDSITGITARHHVLITLT
jgi:hypothetical protein